MTKNKKSNIFSKHLLLLFFLQAREVTVDDVKRVYEVFLDEARSSDNLREYEQYFMFNDLTCM